MLRAGHPRVIKHFRVIQDLAVTYITPHSVIVLYISTYFYLLITHLLFPFFPLEGFLLAIAAVTTDCKI